MSVFQDFLAKEKQQVATSGFNNNNENQYKPTNPIIRLNNKDKPEILVRILPGTGERPELFSAGFRAIGVNYNKKDGSQAFTSLMMPKEAGTSVLDPIIQRWLANKVQFSRFPGNPSNRFFINVLEYVRNPQTQQIVPAMDDNGNPKISPMELPQTAYASLLNNLADVLYAPAGSEYSFIDPNHAFLVRITKAQKGEMSWGVNVYANNDLGALPPNWKEFASDLEKLTTPTEETNPSFVNLVVNRVEGKDLNTNNFAFDRETNTLGGEFKPYEGGSQGGTEVPNSNANPYASNPVDVGDMLPPNMGGNTVQQQQQSNNPWGGVQESNIPDSSIPFDGAYTANTPQQQTSINPWAGASEAITPQQQQQPYAPQQQQQQQSYTQPQQQQAPYAPQQQQQQAPQQQQQAPQQQQQEPQQQNYTEPPEYSQPQSVDSLISSLELDI